MYRSLVSTARIRPWKTSNVRASSSASRSRPGEPDGVAAAGLGLLQRSGGDRQQRRSPSRRAPGRCRRPALNVIGRRSETPNWSARSTSAARTAAHDVAMSVDPCRPGRRSASRPGRIGPARRPAAAPRGQDLDDGQQAVVAGRVAVRLVEQPEVVDVEQGDPERTAVRSRAARPPARPASTTRAVVQAAGQRVPVARVDERGRLPADPTSAPNGTRRTARPRATRAADSVTSTMPRRRSSSCGEDRYRVAPDPDDRPDRAVGHEREVLAQDVARRQGGPGDLASGPVGQAGGGWSPPRAVVKSLVAGRRVPTARRLAGDDHLARRAGGFRCGRSRPRRAGSRVEPRWPAPTVRGGPARPQVVRATAARDERPDQRGVGPDDRVQGRGREVRETMRIWAMAVIPTMAMNTPKTMMKRTGRCVRLGVPNVLMWFAPRRKDGPRPYRHGGRVAHGTKVRSGDRRGVGRSAGGEGGIRTHGVLRLNAFQERRLQPLGHLSGR